jgi:RNA polymerase sigma-70 factor (ECF subfamily)
LVNSYHEHSSGTGPGDLHLAAEVLAGNRQATDRLLSRLSCVVRFVYRLNQTLGLRLSPEGLEDVVQQVYAAVWQKLSDFKGTSALESWVFGFCRNCLRAEARRRRPLPLEPLDERVLEVSDQRADPLVGLHDRQQQDYLIAELGRLAGDEQQAVRLRHLEGWSFERIARHYGVAASTIKDRCYRGLSRLRTRLRRRDVV